VLEGVITGTHHGAFLGRPGTRKLVGCQFVLFSWVKRGEIKKSFLCGNPLAVIEQMKADGADRGIPDGLEVPEKPEVVISAGNPAQVEAVKSFFRTFASGDMAVQLGLMADDVVVHAYGDGKVVRGLAALKQALLKERQIFDGKIEVEHTLAAGPYVVALVHVQGKLRGNLGPLRATGKSFSERGVDVFRFEKGRIKEWDNYRNLMDLMSQLGLYPPPKPSK
jgi:steroid delta-isomerase-like uncharacterized protein